MVPDLLVVLTSIRILKFRLGLQLNGKFKPASCTHCCYNTIAFLEAFSVFHLYIYCLLPTQHLFHLHIHSWNDPDIFYSLHRLKKTPAYRYYSHICLFCCSHSQFLYHFLQLSYPVFVPSIDFFSNFNIAFQYLYYVSFVLLATCFHFSGVFFLFPLLYQCTILLFV